MAPSALLERPPAPTTPAPPSLATRAAATKKKAVVKKKTTKKKVVKKRKKKLPTCTKKDLRTKKSKRRKCKLVKKKPTRSSPTGPIAAPPVTTPSPDAWTPAAVDTRTDGLRTYNGAFGREQATRLLFRGGFGPLPGQADEFASIGVTAAVDRLINPGGATLQGPAPSGDFLVGGQFAPEDRWGHGHLEWLDRMARSTDQLGERMTLILHDWLAISQDGVDAGDMRTSIQLYRDNWRGSFRNLMQQVTVDHAMLNWLNGLWSGKEAPNENYGREVMELFCLGADRGAYTEEDVREMARALTGWVADWSEALGTHNYHFDSSRWDRQEKVLFRGKTYERRGNFNYTDAINAVIDHPLHPSFVALKLWGAFIPTPPTPQTLAELEALYRSGGENLAPLVKAILLHPDLYNGPSVTKSPTTYVAGLLRSRRRGIDDEGWAWMCSQAGQMLWFPPNVSGWNERAWLNTTTYSARWYCASNFINEDEVTQESYEGSSETPAQAVAAALAYWGNPVLTPAHRASLDALSVSAMTTYYWDIEALKRAFRQSALRMLIAASPDFQVS
jgi:hypothetical protein